ncbi:MAG: flagellar motor protein MotB [Myxococcota bacterium]|nr:flagellar motor protein MotB [Myxococcota bacterium]
MFSLLAIGLQGCVALSPNADLVAQLNREIIALHSRTEMLEKTALTCDDPEAPPPAIFADLNQVFYEGDVEISRDGSIVLVTIPGSTLFASGSVRVRKETEMVLDLLATALNAHPDHRVRVVGHTDDAPLTGRLLRAYPSNWELSSARAGSVIRTLVKDYGVAPERFSATGRAEFDPLADNATSAGRASNRRVTLEILPTELP